MKKTIFTLTSILILLSTSYIVKGDDDDYERGEHKQGFFNRFFKESSLDVAPVTNALYKEECGSCHFAYQPGLLPEASWKRMMNNLEDHFDENAELEADIQALLTGYLVDNSADKSNYKRSRKIMNSLRQGNTPLRITETPYFVRKHNELSQRLVENNPKVGSFSKCSACHLGAEKGSYEDDDVRIPGYGRWDD